MGSEALSKPECQSSTRIGWARTHDTPISKTWNWQAISMPVKRLPQLRPQEGKSRSLNTRDTEKTVTSGKAKCGVYFEITCLNIEGKHTLSSSTAVIRRCTDSNVPTFNAFHWANNFKGQGNKWQTILVGRPLNTLLRGNTCYGISWYSTQ